MPDGVVVAGVLLVAGPVMGLVPVAYPPFLSIWSASRERHIATVAEHRRAWWMLNIGFAFATIVTAGGLAALAGALDGALDGSGPRTAMLTATWIAYALGGALWCAVLAIRARTTPVLFDLGAAESAPGSGERMLGAATGGLFAMFIVVTCLALIALGLVLASAGGVAAPVAWLVAAGGAVLLAVQAATGDVIPALLYLPTLLVGVALLAGWT